MKKRVGEMCSAVTDVETLNAMARALERSEARRSSTNLTYARKSVTRRLGISSHAFENFLYLRTKVVPNWLMERVRSELVSTLQAEAVKLEHEIQLHRQTGSQHNDASLASAEAQLASAREILLEGVK